MTNDPHAPAGDPNPNHLDARGPLQDPARALPAIDLNCDAGEAFGPWPMGDDAALMPLVTSVSVACGAHAGDPLVMRRTVELAARYGVCVGAHPGYPDLQGFGRRSLRMTPAEVEDWMLYQIGALAGIARASGVPLRHVKPHGALYNDAADDPALADTIARAVYRYDPALVLVARAGSTQARVGRALGLRVAEEAFADRGYDAHGRLLPRGAAAALIADPAEAGRRALRLVREGGVAAADGTWVALDPVTLCIHSDTPGASAIASAVRTALVAAGVPLRPLGELAR
ncbi:MAG TPA: 5-oxoprolinase subunit PxpA [Ktedonobacterales bacterium]|nr:5-oxoprolinase subunit PxpA [Ktedonobacterales bacterium]